jgi:hypothetical protein
MLGLTGHGTSARGRAQHGRVGYDPRPRQFRPRAESGCMGEPKRNLRIAASNWYRWRRFPALGCIFRILEKPIKPHSPQNRARVGPYPQLTFCCTPRSNYLTTAGELRVPRLRITDQMLERNRSVGIETPRLNDARNPHAPLGGVGV